MRMTEERRGKIKEYETESHDESFLPGFFSKT